MPTECTPDFFGFEPVEGREVVAAFDAGAITSDAGALLLGATDRAIKMMDRFASCFHDVRRAELIEHEVATLVGQRVFGIALGYEDLNDHDELRHDPMMAVLAGKLEARREDCAPVAGKSTLNRLELSRLEPTRYHRISHNPVAIKGLLVDLFLEAHKRAPTEIILDLDARSSRRTRREQAFSFVRPAGGAGNGGERCRCRALARSRHLELLVRSPKVFAHVVPVTVWSPRAGEASECGILPYRLFARKRK